MPPRVQQVTGIRIKHPELGEALETIVEHITASDKLSGVDGSGQVAAPTAPSQLQVSAGTDGSVEFAITDDAVVVQQGGGPSQPSPICYFIEFSTDKNFTNPLPLTHQAGAIRNGRIFVGQQAWYFRCYSQYPGSNPSAFSNVAGPIQVTLLPRGQPPTSLPRKGTGSSLMGRAGAGFGRFS